ncbi:hypothetical protein GX586_08685, partial [bacterium]|nr:hypothetical protein [bacterium]
MTNRERLLAVLDGRAADRVPIWLLFPYHTTGYYVDVRTNPCYTRIYEASKACAVMLDRRNPRVPMWTPDVSERDDSFVDDGWHVSRHTVSCGGITLHSDRREKNGDTAVRKLIDNEHDLEQFLQIPVEVDKGRIEAALDAQLPRYLAERAEFPIEYGAMMLDLGEPIGQLYSHANLTEYPIWSLLYNDQIVAWLDHVMKRHRIVYRYCLERDLADVYFMVGSELASPPMVSRATFQRWIVPYAQELIALVHSYGKKVIQHYHGQIREILPDFLAMAADGLHTIEAPPTGNCTLTEAFDVVGDKITLIGNIQYDCFRSYSQREMRDAVRAVLDEARGKRFI